MDSTIIVATLTALSAIIAPLITTHINNKKEITLKQLDMFYKEKSEAYKVFLTNAASYVEEFIINEDDCPSKSKYFQSFQNAYLVSDDDTRNKLEKLDKYFYGPSMQENVLKNLLSEVSKSMGKNLSTYHSKKM